MTALALVHSGPPSAPPDVFEEHATAARASLAKLRREAWRVYSAPFMAQVIGQALEESAS